VGRVFFLLLLSGVAAVSLARPWIGVVCAYLIAILTPQAVWFWNFEGLRPVYWVLLPTMIGFLVAAFQQKYTLATIRNSRVALLFVLWLCFLASYLFGPYVAAGGPYRFTDPAWAWSTLNKMFVLMLLGLVCLDDVKKLKALVGVFLLSGVYLIYWANDQYLSGRAWGRLRGPVDVYGVGIYSDENNFAMLFVVVLPFLWYAGQAFEKRIWRWAVWLIIPFGWHAIFLTASRGGLVGVAATILLTALRSKNKLLGLLLIPAFAGAYVWQAGDLMRSRAETISEFQTETSAATRLEAWTAAAGMIADHPITGVGLASFGPAYPDYSDKKPREAHNTFFQIAAESGLLAGVAYVLIYVISIRALWRNGTRLRRLSTTGPPAFVYLANEATLVSMFGLMVCSLFLSLQMFEIFYCLSLMVNIVLYVSRERSSATAGQGIMMPEPETRPAALRTRGLARRSSGRRYR
jgi:hypothetical protein